MRRNVISNIDEEKKIIGMGSVTGSQTYWAVFMKEALAAMVLIGVIFRWGFVGLILFILLYIFLCSKLLFFSRCQMELYPTLHDWFYYISLRRLLKVLLIGFLCQSMGLPLVYDHLPYYH